MTLTEDEAKTKRCQESFPAAGGLSIGGTAEAVYISTLHLGADTLSARHTAPAHCIGSACMAWVWWDSHSSPPTGYCGKVR